MGGYISDVNWGGHYLGRVDLRLILDEAETPILWHFHEGFKIFCCSLIELDVEDSNPDHIHLLESGVTRYRWDGSAFVKIDYQASRLLKVIEPKPTFKASGPDGVLAEITYEFNGYVSPANDVCQLHIAGEPVGPRFGCKRAHVSVEWKDITSDGMDEIIITAYSGPFPYDRDGTVLSDEEFPHQRLMAYQWEGDEAKIIANISGYVVQEDLYGVRLEDYDSDGQLEILAAGGLFSPSEGCHMPEYQDECWYVLSYHNVIYEWDGERFVLNQILND
jgi:hypothetical protein